MGILTRQITCAALYACPSCLATDLKLYTFYLASCLVDRKGKMIINHSGKFDSGKKESLQLIGSQMSFTLRSNPSSAFEPSYIRKSRPRSAVLPCKNQTTNKSKLNCMRPKSAEVSDLGRFSFNNQNQWLFEESEKIISEKTSIPISHYTSSSSELLQTLMGSPIVDPTRTDPIDDTTETDRCNDVDKARAKSEKICKKTSCTKYREIVETDQEGFEYDWKIVGKNLRPNENDLEAEVSCRCSVRPRIEPAFEETSTGFNFAAECHVENAADHKSKKGESEFSPKKERGNDSSHLPDGHLYIGESFRLGKESPRGVSFCQSLLSARNNSIENNEESAGVGDLKTEAGNVSGKETTHPNGSSEKEMRKIKNSDRDSKTEENEAKVNGRTTTEILITEDSNKSEIRNGSNENKRGSGRSCLERFGSATSDSNSSDRRVSPPNPEEPSKLLQAIEEGMEIASRHDESASTEDSTYEEIVSLLRTIDADETEIQEMEKDSEEVLMQAAMASREKNLTNYSETLASPRLERLMRKDPVELAHEVLSLKIQMEDQKKGIKLLRETIAEMKRKNATADLDHREALNKANAEAEALIRRHQKFIKQLLNEKKNLNETVTKLVQNLKSEEEKFKKNMKAIEERHSIEIKRAKEAQAIADKIKREKWMESKTQKIKEMTVKGLEPELSRMAVQQQQEITELKSLQKAELEAVELKAARRTSELLNQLREELTREKSNAIDRETNNLRAKMERDFEEERNKQELVHQRLKERIRREEEKVVNQEREFQQKMLDQKREVEMEKQKMERDFQEKLDQVRQRHIVELKNLGESLEEEKGKWMSNYKKQESARLFERESELRQECKRERDKDVEVVIEMLEKESARLQLELNEAWENKTKRLREKFESEMKEAEENEARLRSKLSKVQSQLLAKEELIAEVNSRIRQQETELIFLRKRCEEMTSERNNLKNIIRKEFEVNLAEMNKEKEILRKEISVLKEIQLKELAKKDQINLQVKNEMQKELAKVYSRIKAAANKKEIVIESLRKENKETMDRCHQLELLLENQRKNLLLQ